MNAADIDNLPQLLSIAQAGAVLGVDESTINGWLRAGTCPFPVRIVGGRRKVAKVRLMAWLAEEAAA